MTMDLLGVAGTAFALSLVASWPLSVLFTQLGIVAIPNSRSSHSTPTAVGVGILVPATVALALLATEGRLTVASATALGFAAVGFVDDLLDSPAVTRLVVQCAVALAGVASLGGLPTLLTLPAVVVVVGTVNGLNFMDGINGITASLGILLGLTLLLMALQVDSTSWQLVGAVTAAACAGYLPNNLPLPRSFPGDVLPYFLAATFALGLVDMASASPVLLLGVGPLVPAFIDTSSTLVRRSRSGHQLLTPHRDHAYQRLARRTSHTSATLTYLALALLCSGALPVGLTCGPGPGAVFLACSFTVCFLVLARVPMDPP